MRPGTRIIRSIAGAIFVLLSVFVIREYSTSPVTKLTDVIHSAHIVEIRSLSSGSSGVLRLDDSTSLEFLNLLEDHELTTEIQTMSHEPEWELRFIGDLGISTTATLSLECSNIYFRDYLNRTLWVTILDESVPPMEVPRLVEFFEAIAAHTANRSQ